MIQCSASTSCKLPVFELVLFVGGLPHLCVTLAKKRLLLNCFDGCTLLRRYMKDGGSRAWHYDGSDFVVTLMLQPSLAGGEFEWAPFIRGENGEENYDQVRTLLFHQHVKNEK